MNYTSSVDKKLTVEEREGKLIDKLATYRLTIRGDSKLCSNYNEKGDIDINFVVSRACQVRYLFRYCHMKKIIKEVEGFLTDVRSFGFDVNFYPVFEHAEKLALKRYGDYPKDFPWMMDVSEYDEEFTEGKRKRTFKKGFEHMCKRK